MKRGATQTTLRLSALENNRCNRPEPARSAYMPAVGHLRSPAQDHSVVRGQLLIRLGLPAGGAWRREQAAIAQELPEIRLVNLVPDRPSDAPDPEHRQEPREAG